MRKTKTLKSRKTTLSKKKLRKSKKRNPLKRIQKGGFPDDESLFYLVNFRRHCNRLLRYFNSESFLKLQKQLDEGLYNERLRLPSGQYLLMFFRALLTFKRDFEKLYNDTLQRGAEARLVFQKYGLASLLDYSSREKFALQEAIDKTHIIHNLIRENETPDHTLQKEMETICGSKLRHDLKRIMLKCQTIEMMIEIYSIEFPTIIPNLVTVTIVTPGTPAAPMDPEKERFGTSDAPMFYSDSEKALFQEKNLPKILAAEEDD